MEENRYKKAIDLGITDKIFVIEGLEIKSCGIISIKNNRDGKLEIHCSKRADLSNSEDFLIDLDKSSAIGRFSQAYFIDYKCAETAQRNLMQNRVEEAQKKLDEALKNHQEAIENQRKVLNQQRLNAM